MYCILLESSGNGRLLKVMGAQMICNALKMSLPCNLWLDECMLATPHKQRSIITVLDRPSVTILDLSERTM